MPTCDYTVPAFRLTAWVQRRQEAGTTTERWERGGASYRPAWAAASTSHVRCPAGREVYSKRGAAGCQPLRLLGWCRGRYLGLGRIQVAAERPGGLACGFGQGREGSNSEMFTLASCTGKTVQLSIATRELEHEHGTPAMPWRPWPCTAHPAASGRLLQACWAPTCR